MAAALRPVIPVVDVHIGSTHTSAPNSDQHFIVAYLRDGDIAHYKTRTCDLFDKRFHAFNSETW
jgi:hypothetical protein